MVMVKSFVSANFTLTSLLLMTVVMNTRPYQSLNVTIYHLTFLNVQYTQPDSDSQRFKSGGLIKSLVEHKSP